MIHIQLLFALLYHDPKEGADMSEQRGSFDMPAPLDKYNLINYCLSPNFPHSR